MTTIRRYIAALTTVLATFATVIALGSSAIAQVPPPDRDTSPAPAPTTTPIVHNGAPMWLLVVVALAAAAVTLACVAAAPKVRNSYQAIWAH